MKLSINSKLTALLAVSALAMTGCQDEEFGYEAEKIAYEKTFKDIYGKIDANQSWNMASANTITVGSVSTGDVEIFAKNGTDYQLVASYKDVQSGQTLHFDALAGTSKVLVSDGLSAQEVNIGGTVNFASGTRAIMTGTNQGITIAATTNGDAGCDADGYRYFTQEEITAYTTVAPEGEDNTKRVTCNFQMVSNGTFTIFPLYWETSSWSNIGVYYKDVNGDVHNVEIYKGKEGDDFQYYSNDANGDHSTGDYGWVSFTHAHIVGALNFAHADGNDYKLRSKGIKVTIPVGTVFGMYIDIQSNVQDELADEWKWKNYSDAELNSSAYRSTTSGAANYINTQCINKSLAAFYTVNGRTYISFEDWNPDNDLNDMVFYLNGDLPTAIDKTATEWLIACEDRSETKGDNDFNDIVFKVSHGTDNSYVNVTPVAAAGTYASYIYYGDPTTTGINLGEIHKLVDPSATISGTLYTQINGESIDREGSPIHVTVPTTFSLDQYLPSTDQTSNQKRNNYESFYIRSERQDGTGTANAQIVFPSRGDVPAMFCVPASWTIGGVKYIWPWPKEGIGISTAYPNFSKWVSDPSSNQEWYQTYNTDKVVSGSYSISTTTTTDASGSLNNLQPLKATPSALTLEVGQNKEITLSSGSDGAYSIVAGNSSYITASLSGNVITVHGVAETTTPAIINVIQNASSDGKYSQQTLDIKVTVEAEKTLSEFSVNETSVETSYGGSAKTLTIKSKSDTTPRTASLSSAACSLGTMSQVSGPDGDGFYSWTVTVTPSAVGDATFKIIQDANATYSAGEQQIDVTVNYAASTFIVAPTTLTFKPNGAAQTISIYSDNNDTDPIKSALSILSGDNDFVSVTDITKTTGSNYEGVYYTNVWTITVTPAAIGSATFTVKQDPSETHEGGDETTVTINVKAEKSLTLDNKGDLSGWGTTVYLVSGDASDLAVGKKLKLTYNTGYTNINVDLGSQATTSDICQGVRDGSYTITADKIDKFTIADGKFSFYVTAWYSTNNPIEKIVIE